MFSDGSVHSLAHLAINDMVQGRGRIGLNPWQPGSSEREKGGTRTIIYLVKVTPTTYLQPGPTSYIHRNHLCINSIMSIAPPTPSCHFLNTENLREVLDLEL